MERDRNLPEQPEEYSDQESKSLSEQGTETRTVHTESDTSGNISPSDFVTHGGSAEEKKDTRLPDAIEAAVAHSFSKIGFHILNAREPDLEPELLVCKRCGGIEETKELLQKVRSCIPIFIFTWGRILTCPLILAH